MDMDEGVGGLELKYEDVQRYLQMCLRRGCICCLSSLGKLTLTNYLNTLVSSMLMLVSR